MNPTELAQISGVPRTSISSILSGKRNPGPKVWSKILAALQLTPEDAYRLFREASAGSQRLASLLNVAKSLFAIDPEPIAKFVAAHFSERVCELQWPAREQLEIRQSDSGRRLSLGIKGAETPKDEESEKKERAEIAEVLCDPGNWDFYVICTSGNSIGVKCKGILTIAAKAKTRECLPPCDPVQVLRAGGAVFRPVAIIEEELGEDEGAV